MKNTSICCWPGNQKMPNAVVVCFCQFSSPSATQTDKGSENTENYFTKPTKKSFQNEL